MFSLKRHYLKLYIFISFLVHLQSFVDMVKIGFHSPKTVTSRCILNNDKSFLYNNDVTESLDHAKTTYMLPLYLISNSAHCEHCSALWITVALISMVSVLWEFLWLRWKQWLIVGDLLADVLYSTQHLWTLASYLLVFLLF